MGERGIAFLMARERPGEDSLGPQLKAQFGGAYIANEGLDFASARWLLEEGAADAAGFGRLFIANPDLVERFRRNAPLNAWNTETFYGSGAVGYVDYPALADAGG